MAAYCLAMESMAWRRRAQGYAGRLIPAPLLPLFPRPTTAEAGKSLPAGIRTGYGLGMG